MRKTGISRIVFSVVLVYLVSSCSEFRRVQKSDDWKLKYDKAMEYYEKGDYYRSIALFEEVLPLTRGKIEGEKAQFYYAYAHFKDRQYILSAHYFKTFYETYSRSQFAQEAQFMYAYSLYMDSPLYSLDQTNTRDAIDALQAFINRYPESEFEKQANDIINELQVKLETKAYYNAKEYYKIGLLLSAKVAFENFSKDYPDSKYNEELRFLRIEATFKVAQKSIPSKQKERYHEVIELYEKFVDRYPDSKYLNMAEKYYSSALNSLEKNLS
ncbi:MAG: outer membrane protein assembly factor BamD [Cyclobacteriaceae bacterium]|nr:outer membrane protein assembly factor BamD [Cyclobacteriaceae bacterium]